MLEREEHGGNQRKLREIMPDMVDFSANINPLGPPSWVRGLISRTVSELIHYPDPESRAFCQAVAQFHGVETSRIVAGNGTAELLYGILHCQKKTRVHLPLPSYIDYLHAARQAGHDVIPHILREESGFEVDLKMLAMGFRAGDICILGLPNNPTGVLPDLALLAEMIEVHADVLFILDEAFLSFIPGIHSFAGRYPNVMSLHSMTKFFALPGLRIGYACLPIEDAKTLRNHIPPWSVNTFAQAVGEKLYADHQYRDETLCYCAESRQKFIEGLKAFSEIKVFEGQVNYLFCKLLKGDIDLFYKKLLAQGFAIRLCNNYEGLTGPYFRIAVKKIEENDAFISALSKVFGEKIKRVAVQKTPALMLQGTCSNAGKSVLTAALCRIFSDDGISVAPFKAQNMSLNSFVTHDGREMGRAQVVQAQAARILPDYRMNPILLKPNTDVGSQVIVNGLAVGNMAVREYHRYKETAWQKATESYDALASQYQLMVLEGAGSPGEVNLKRHDIVNMKMAQYAKAPVLLVGDIDRGGVYASFVGIMEVLDQWERDLVAGFIVNRFRGDATLLSDAHDFVRAHCGKDVLGVVPYLKGLGIPEEDSVSFKAGHLGSVARESEYIRIAVISLPHISNFTDIEPFLGEPDVQLIIANSPEDIRDADAIILPGSKNVMGDLRWLKSSGFGDAIRHAREEGVTIVGICGGYQIMGQNVCDPYAIESCFDSESQEETALGFLPITTVIEKQKQLVQKRGIHRSSAMPVHGYEIHHGTSHGIEKGLLLFDDGTSCGVEINPKLWGSYLHGIFDSDPFRRWFINELRRAKGYAPRQSAYIYDLEQAFDRLAATVRQGLDMDKIYSLIKL